MRAILILNKIRSPLKEYHKRELKNEILDSEQLLQTELFNVSASLPYIKSLWSLPHFILPYFCV